MRSVFIHLIRQLGQYSRFVKAKYPFFLFAETFGEKYIIFCISFYVTNVFFSSVFELKKQ